MHSTLRRAAPCLPARERDRALDGLGGYALRAARHDMHSPDESFAEPQTDAGSQRADSSCLRPPIEVKNDGGPTGFILRGIVDWDGGSCC